MPTIVPLVSEADWLGMLATVPTQDLLLESTVVLSPHPDDETLGCGGMIAALRNRSVEVSVVAITDGERAYADAEGLAAVRVREQTEALQRLGVSESSVHRLQLPDSDVASFEDRLVELLLPLVPSGTHLVAPWPHDFHPDHEATGRAAARVARRVGIPLTYYLFWTWHRGSPDSLSGCQLIKIPLSEGERKSKILALEAHASQFQHEDGQPILSPDLIKPAKWPFEVYVR
jgi:LmbE family N-acetylglucosaminyl deacetylase